MKNYRWDTSDFALGYDASADAVHPHYIALQDAILESLPKSLAEGGLVIDLGGGSGRLMERILERFPGARGIVIDQSEPFLALAERRLEQFDQRGACIQARLQDDWRSALPGPATAIVSMSAIHHLEPAEKAQLYRECHEALAPGGVLLNGDEVRPADDQAYLQLLSDWADHMRRGMESGTISPVFHPALHKWIERNVTRFGEPKRSGDDCLETIDAQLAYYRSAGFTTADAPWHQQLWALLRGQK